MSERETIFWRIRSGGRYITDPLAVLVINEAGQINREYVDPTNASLQRIIYLSHYHGVEIEDGIIEVYGGIKRDKNSKPPW